MDEDTSFSSSQFEESLKYAAQKLRIPNFRPEQKDAILNFLKGHDVFLALPTNSGKSKIFQGIPLCHDFLNRQQSQAAKSSLAPDGRAIAIVISPIVAIIEQQVAELTEKGVSALYLRVDDNWGHESAKIKSGQYSVLYTSPETLANSSAKDLLSSSQVRTKICGIFVDESHCIEQW